MRRTTPFAALLLAGVLAACGGETDSPSATAEAPSEAASEVPSIEASVEPSEGAEPSDDGTGSENGGELAEILPAEVGGLEIDYTFTSGAGNFDGEGMPPEAQDFLDDLGASADDVHSAFGLAFDTSDLENPGFITIVAVQVSGADEDQLRDGFRATLEQEGSTITEETIAGKDVLAFTSEGEGGTLAYMYVTGDVVAILGAEPPELLEEALSALP